MEGFTPRTPHNLQMDEEEGGHHHLWMLETRDPIFRFVEKSNGVVTTLTTSPFALNCVSLSNVITEYTSMEPPYLTVAHAQYKMFPKPIGPCVEIFSLCSI